MGRLEKKQFVAVGVAGGGMMLLLLAALLSTEASGTVALGTGAGGGILVFSGMIMHRAVARKIVTNGDRAP